MNIHCTPQLHKGKGKDVMVLRMELRRSVRRCSSPLSQAIEPVGGYTTESVTHGQCNARSTVTFPLPANGRYQFILLGEQRHTVCEQLAHSRYMKRSGRDSNLRGCKFDALTMQPLRHHATHNYIPQPQSI